jgi:hypothetical protein
MNLGLRAITVGRELGHSMKILNIGGGFPHDNLTEKTSTEIN